MKKTLIALAAVAVSGSAFAANHAAAAGSGSFVKFSGKFGTSVVKSTVGTDNVATGIAVTDGDLRVDAVEDLGGGLKGFAAMELRVRGRGAVDDGSSTGQASGVGGRNATVGIDSASMGALALGSIEFGNGIKGRGWAGAPIGIAFALENDSKGKFGPLANAANADALLYTSPELIKGLRVMYIRGDSIGDPGTAKGAAVNAYQAHYDDGGLGITVDYSKFNAAVTDRTRIRVAGSYNFGPVALGAGYEDNNKSTAQNNAANYTVGVRVPLGAIVLGAVYAKSDAKATGNSQTGYGAAVQYDFSKRTNVNYTFLNQTGATGGTTGDQYNGTRHQLRLMHAF